MASNISFSSFSISEFFKFDTISSNFGYKLFFFAPILSMNIEIAIAIL